MTSAATVDWTIKRNLNRSSEREILIYVMGRIGKEVIPTELLVFLANKFGSVTGNSEQ